MVPSLPVCLSLSPFLLFSPSLYLSLSLALFLSLPLSLSLSLSLPPSLPPFSSLILARSLALSLSRSLALPLHHSPSMQRTEGFPYSVNPQVTPTSCISIVNFQSRMAQITNSNNRLKWQAVESGDTANAAGFLSSAVRAGKGRSAPCQSRVCVCACVHVCMCVCVCRLTRVSVFVCKKERDREREREGVFEPPDVSP